MSIRRRDIGPPCAVNRNQRILSCDHKSHASKRNHAPVRAKRGVLTSPCRRKHSIRRAQEPVLESEARRSLYCCSFCSSESLTETPIPRPGSMRFTEQSNFTGRSNTRRAVNPAPSHKGSGDSMNIPFELISRVLARKIADPHSISRVARNAYLCAHLRSARRDTWSPLPIDLVPPCQGSQGAAQEPARRATILSIRLLNALSYDAACRCFVPGNPGHRGDRHSARVLKLRARVCGETQDLFLVSRSWRFGDVFLLAEFLSSSNSPLHFRLQILAQTLRNDSR